MFKKFIFSLFFLTGIALANAQHVPGSWKIIPMTGTSFEYVQDTPSKVYYLSSGSLYSYDKDDNETVYYTPGTRISDSSIKFIKYNGDKKYLVLVYSNNNIDLIYDTGKVVNLPEIKDANLTAAKTVNSVQFGKDRIYIGTSFGIVVYDDKDHFVIESGIYNENITDVFELGDNIVLFKGGDFMFSPKRERHNTLSKFTLGGTSFNNRYLTPVSDNAYLTLVKNGNNENLVKVTYNFDTKQYESTQLATIPSGKGIFKYKEGYYAPGSNGFYLTDATGEYKGVESYPTTYGSQTLSFWNSPSSFWAGNADGIGSFTLSNGTVEALNAKYFPESSKQFKTWYAVNHPDGKKVYISEAGRSDFFPNVGNSRNPNIKLLHEVYDWETGILSPHHLYNAGGTYGGGSSKVLYDLEEPEYIYVGCLIYGLSVFNDCEQTAQFDNTNSPLNDRAISQIYDMCYDNNGNLWMIMWMVNENYVEGSTTSPIKILSKENLEYAKHNPDKLKEKINGEYVNWLQHERFPNLSGWIDARVLMSSSIGKGLCFNGGWRSAVFGIDTKGTTSVNDDVFQAYTAFRDQDGTITSTVRKPWMVEDKKGWIWIGTDAGVFVVKDLDQIADGSSNYLDVVRPKVARNDGTNYADYLLSADFIINIAVDSNNRKWIATTTSGLYCVNEDGTEILYEFNKDNSPLVSNVVTMVACQPNGNDVLIGTPEGLFVYSSDSAPAKDDYSEVYAYPNPVRPDYTGWISINGLMDNSLVKITDAQGSVLWQGRSDGGMVVWDGCDSTGKRVRSGVYMVMASQNTDGNSGVVTKIVVIN